MPNIHAALGVVALLEVAVLSRLPSETDPRVTHMHACRYLCNLGAPRNRLTQIVIETTACHVQIASHEGSGYTLYARGLAG